MKILPSTFVILVGLIIGGGRLNIVAKIQKIPWVSKEKFQTQKKVLVLVVAKPQRQYAWQIFALGTSPTNWSIHYLCGRAYLTAKQPTCSKRSSMVPIVLANTQFYPFGALRWRGGTVGKPQRDNEMMKLHGNFLRLWSGSSLNFHPWHFLISLSKIFDIQLTIRNIVQLMWSMELVACLFTAKWLEFCSLL